MTAEETVTVEDAAGIKDTGDEIVFNRPEIFSSPDRLKDEISVIAFFCAAPEKAEFITPKTTLTDHKKAEAVKQITKIIAPT